MPENDSGRCTYMYRHEQSQAELQQDGTGEGEAASDSVKELLEGVVM